MYQWVMNENGAVLPRQTLLSINVGEVNSDIEERKRNNFDAKIQLKLGGYIYPPK